MNPIGRWTTGASAATGTRAPYCPDDRSISSIGRMPSSRALVDADVHAAGQHGVAAREGVAERDGVEAGASVTEILEGHRLQGDRVGRALPGEGLHGLSSAMWGKVPRKAYSSPSRSAT